VDVLTSILTMVFVFVLVNFSKAALEPLWKISPFSFSFRLGRVRLVVRTFKYTFNELLHFDHYTKMVRSFYFIAVTIRHSSPVLVVAGDEYSSFYYFLHFLNYP
jgi:hypothetical protein